MAITGVEGRAGTVWEISISREESSCNIQETEDSSSLIGSLGGRGTRFAPRGGLA